MKHSTRRTCLLLFWIFGGRVESSRVETSYQPRSQTLDALKQQNLEKAINEQVKTFKAMAGAHHATSNSLGSPAHHTLSNKSKIMSNPHVRHMQELLNGTAMANVTLHNEVYHLSDTEKKIADQAKESLSPKGNQQKQVKHAEQPINQSAPLSDVAPSKKQESPLSGHVHELAGMVNTTAKELNINISSARAAVEVHLKPKVYHVDDRKKKVLDRAKKSLFPKENQQQQVGHVEQPINQSVPSSHVAPIKKGESSLSGHVHELAGMVNTTAKELNINTSKVRAVVEMQPERNVHHVSDKEKKDQAKKSFFRGQNQQKQAKHVQQPINQSAPLSHVTPSKNDKSPLSGHVHKLAGMVNTTAKELNINVSGPQADMHSEHAEKLKKKRQEKASDKDLANPSSAQKREIQTEREQKLDQEVQKQMDQVGRRRIVIHKQEKVDDTDEDVITKDANRMARHLKEFVDAANASPMKQMNHTNLKSLAA